MRKSRDFKVWIPALLLAVGMVACGDPDKNSGGPTSPLTPPTVISVLPAGASAPCPSTLISATFSKPMNPATINATTFTVTPGVTGSITADATNTTFTLTPSSALTLGTLYTATITTGAHDQFGVPLAADFVWTFTPQGCGPPPPPVGSACGIGILGATPSVANVGPTHVTGDVDISPAASVTGFPPGTFTGTEHLADAVAATAQTDLNTAYIAARDAGGGPAVGTALTADIGGQTLPPGIYKATTALGITGDLTLSGNAGGVWIFKVGSALTTAAGGPSTPMSRVLLIGGAQSKNVYWQIGSSATLGTYSTMEGTIMALSSITLGTGATLNGRALAHTGAIALDSNPVNVPPCQ